MQKVRVFQRTSEKKRLGPKRCPWSVEWRERGRRRLKTVGSEEDAEEFAARKRVELADELVGRHTHHSWAEFVAEYVEKRVSHFRSAQSRRPACKSLERFGSLTKPRWVSDVDTKLLDEFVHKRLAQRGRNGDPISPETVKKDLRTIRAALNVAKDWGYVRDVPRMPNPKGHASDKRFVSEEHFDKMMDACHVAKKPDPKLHPDVDREKWWKALLATAWVTGMRIGALLALRWEDVDLERATAWSRARDNKSKRDLRHDIAGAVPWLQQLPRLDPRVFPWNHHERTLWVEFAAIQEEAEIDLPCLVKAGSPDHHCTDACHLYGFHDLRRAHATYNYGKVSDRALQQQMGHANFQTTQRYVKYAELHRTENYEGHLPKSLRNGDKTETKDGDKAGFRVFGG